MPDGLFGLSTNPANFGIDQPPDQGAQELEQAIQQINRQNAPAFLEPLRVMGAEMSARSEMAKLEQVPSFKNLKFNSDGTVDASGVSIDTIQDLFGARDFQRRTLGGFAQQAAQLETELKRAQSQPWQQLATALAANMATQKDMPGWVRGMGQTAAQMNPSVDQLRARYLATMGQGAEIAKGVRAEDIAEQRTQADMAQAQSAEAMRSEAQRQTRIEKSYDNAAEAIKVGPGMVNTKAIARNLALAGATPEEIAARLDELGNLAANVGKRFEIQRDDVLAAQKLAMEQEERRGRRGDRDIAMQEKRLKVSEDRLQLAEFLSQKSDYTRNTSLSVGEQQAMMTALNAQNLVGKMEALAKTKTIGPITGRIQYMNPYRDAEWQQITNYADQLLLSGLNGKLGAGVSDRDVMLMRSVMPNGKMTPEQFAATTKVMRSLQPDNLVRLMHANPNVQYWESIRPEFEKMGMGKVFAQTMETILPENAKNYPALFGVDRPAIAERTFGPHTKVEPKRSGEAKSSGAPSYDEFLEWQKSQGKK